MGRTRISDCVVMLMSLPNLLTLSRILAIPLIVALIYIDTPLFRWLTLASFTLAGVTDYLDGYLARKWQATTTFGRIMDPFCDKFLVIGAYIYLAGPR